MPYPATIIFGSTLDSSLLQRISAEFKDIDATNKQYTFLSNTPDLIYNMDIGVITFINIQDAYVGLLRGVVQGMSMPVFEERINMLKTRNERHTINVQASSTKRLWFKVSSKLIPSFSLLLQEAYYPFIKVVPQIPSVKTAEKLREFLEDKIFFFAAMNLPTTLKKHFEEYTHFEHLKPAQNQAETHKMLHTTLNPIYLQLQASLSDIQTPSQPPTIEQAETPPQEPPLHLDQVAKIWFHVDTYLYYEIHSFFINADFYQYVGNISASTSYSEETLNKIIQNTLFIISDMKKPKTYTDIYESSYLESFSSLDYTQRREKIEHFFEELILKIKQSPDEVKDILATLTHTDISSEEESTETPISQEVLNTAQKIWFHLPPYLYYQYFPILGGFSFLYFTGAMDYKFEERIDEHLNHILFIISFYKKPERYSDILETDALHPVIEAYTQQSEKEKKLLAFFEYLTNMIKDNPQGVTESLTTTLKMLNQNDTTQSTTQDATTPASNVPCFNLEHFIGAEAFKTWAKRFLKAEQAGYKARGILLVGMQGVGKKFLAQCFAGESGRVFIECNIEFFSKNYLNSILKSPNHKQDTKYLIFIEGIEMIEKQNSYQALIQLYKILEETPQPPFMLCVSIHSLSKILEYYPELLERGKWDELFLLQTINAKQAREILKIYTEKQGLSSILSENMLERIIGMIESLHKAPQDTFPYTAGEIVYFCRKLELFQKWYASEHATAEIPTTAILTHIHECISHCVPFYSLAKNELECMNAHKGYFICEQESMRLIAHKPKASDLQAWDNI